MPYCKNCRTRLDKFNKDRCPICGVENPFDGINSDTVEITTNIDTSDLKLDYHPRSKVIFLILFTLGIFGIPFFYIYKYKTAIIWLIANLLGIAGVIVALLFTVEFHPALVVLFTILLFILVNFLLGVAIYNKPNLKDGRGDFLL